MEKILFINSCVRENSRTLELAECVLENINCGNCEINELNLESENLKPLDEKLLYARERYVGKNDFSEDSFRYAKDFADADTIVIAAPYWDFAFPALLKIYLERITVCGITFRYSGKTPQGLCRAKRLIYVTTSGGPLYYNFGFDYVKALSEKLYGINEVLFFSAENLDIEGNDVNGIIQTAKNKICGFFSNKQNKRRNVK